MDILCCSAIEYQGTIALAVFIDHDREYSEHITITDTTHIGWYHHFNALMPEGSITR